MAPKTTMTSGEHGGPEGDAQAGPDELPDGHVPRAQRREDHGHVRLQPADAGHDRVGRLEGRRLHGLRDEQPGRQEGQVASTPVDAGRVGVVDEGPEADADGGQEEDGVQEGREERAAPGPPVDEEMVLDDPLDGAGRDRDAHGPFTR